MGEVQKVEVKQVEVKLASQTISDLRNTFDSVVRQYERRQQNQYQQGLRDALTMVEAQREKHRSVGLDSAYAALLVMLQRAKGSS